MHRWADTGVGVDGVQQPHTSGQKIISWKQQRSEILPGREENEARQCDNLRRDKVDLQSFKTLCMIEHEIHQGKQDQKVPQYIRNQKILIEWYKIINAAMNAITPIGRNEMFGQYEQGQIDDPSP